MSGAPSTWATRGWSSSTSGTCDGRWSPTPQPPLDPHPARRGLYVRPWAGDVRSGERVCTEGNGSERRTRPAPTPAPRSEKGGSPARGLTLHPPTAMEGQARRATGTQHPAGALERWPPRGRLEGHGIYVDESPGQGYPGLSPPQLSPARMGEFAPGIPMPYRTRDWAVTTRTLCGARPFQLVSGTGKWCSLVTGETWPATVRRPPFPPFGRHLATIFREADRTLGASREGRDQRERYLNKRLVRAVYHALDQRCATGSGASILGAVERSR